MLVWVSFKNCHKRGLQRIQNHIKLVDSTDNSVNIMFRPAYFVILFAVVLCVTALPAPQATRGPPLPSRGPGAGLAPKQPILGPDGKPVSAKGDLDTDATEYWGYRYNYHVPNWNVYEPTLYGWPRYYY